MLCEHFGRCGGCTYLDISYADELAIKEKDLRETLGKYSDLLGGIHPSPNVSGYRNKMELAFGDEGKDGRLAVGMRKKRSFYEVATPDHCVLIPDDFKQVIMCVLEYFRETGEAFFHRKRHVGALRHLVLRRGEFTGEVLVNLSTTSGLIAPLAPLVERLCALPLAGRLVGVLHSVNDGVADAVKDEDTRVLWGQDFYNESICGLKFKVSAYSFFQTNSAGAEVLYGVVKDYASVRSGVAFDLYCGTGTISQIISPLFEKVVGIELVEDAIKAAKDNAQLNGIENCDFFAGDVLAALGENGELANLTPNIVVVDPPRDGLHPKALAKMIEINPEWIVYVACKPKSLARDLAVLTDAGYVLKKLQGVDMFPRTPHVEAVALMRWQDA